MILLDSNLRKIVSRCIRKYGTNNPYEIADAMGIEVFFVPLGKLCGYYQYLKRHMCIYINSELDDENFAKFVMAHELGHAIMHKKAQCYFAEKNTFLNTSKYEMEANQFAALLLISDEDIMEYSEYTIEQFARILNYQCSIVNLRLSMGLQDN